MHAAPIELVESLPPADEVGERHRDEALTRLRRTDDVYRRLKPATPSPHLVVHFLLVDRPAGLVLLRDHRLSGLWLPTGGHVEPGEDPAVTVRREAQEELGLRIGAVAAPFLLTVTDTVGAPRSSSRASAGGAGRRSLQPARAASSPTSSTLWTPCLCERGARQQEERRSAGRTGPNSPAEARSSC